MTFNKGDVLFSEKMIYMKDGRRESGSNMLKGINCSYQGISAGSVFHHRCFRQVIVNKLRVHSVFHRVVNLRWSNEILSLVSPEVGRAATYLVIDLPENVDFLSLDVREGMPVAFSDGWLTVDERFSIDCRNTPCWTGRSPEELRWRGEELPLENLRALRLAIGRWGVPGGLLELISDPYHPLSQRLHQLLNALREASSANGNLARAVQGVIGFGPGLTPSGDDLLLGFLAAAGVGVNYRPVLAPLHKALKCNLKRTNDLSGYFLSQAMRGFFHEYLEEVIHAVVRGSAEQVTAATRNLIRIGSTSGTDLAAGVYLAFYHDWKRCRSEENCGAQLLKK